MILFLKDIVMILSHSATQGAATKVGYWILDSRLVILVFLYRLLYILKSER